MAAKKNADASVRLKAQQMREAQEKADKRNRAIVVSIVAVVVLAVIATVAIVIGNQLKAKNEAETADPTTTLGEYAGGAPVLYSHLGIGKVDDSLPTLTEYFDYSCHACANIDVLIGQTVSDDAKNGEYNIEFQPVTTVGMAYANPATSASLIVAQKDPDHWIAFHHSLLSYFRSQFNAGKGTVIQDQQKSWEQVKTLATEAGVPSDVVKTFPVNVVTDYLSTSTAAWKAANIADRNGLGTPEFVKDHSTRITLSGNDATAILASLRTGMGLSSTAQSGSDSAQSK